MDNAGNKCHSLAPPKHVKSRSKSIDESQQAKKAFYTQKSLPGKPELQKLHEVHESTETPTSSSEELK